MPSDLLRPLSLAIPAVLLVFAFTGCASHPVASKPELVNVVLPHVEHLDVSTCEGRPAAINRVLSTRAETFASEIEHGSVWYGEGASMEPVLQPGSWIVIRPLMFTELEPGMIVLYRSSSGLPVAHALIRRTSRGWLAAGVNNTSPDRDFVTPENLAGVIAGVFVAAR